MVHIQTMLLCKSVMSNLCLMSNLVNSNSINKVVLIHFPDFISSHFSCIFPSVPWGMDSHWCLIFLGCNIFAFPCNRPTFVFPHKTFAWPRNTLALLQTSLMASHDQNSHSCWLYLCVRRCYDTRSLAHNICYFIPKVRLINGAKVRSLCGLFRPCFLHPFYA